MGAWSSDIFPRLNCPTMHSFLELPGSSSRRNFTGSRMVDFADQNPRQLMSQFDQVALKLFTLTIGASLASEP